MRTEQLCIAESVSESMSRFDAIKTRLRPLHHHIYAAGHSNKVVGISLGSSYFPISIQLTPSLCFSSLFLLSKDRTRL